MLVPRDTRKNHQRPALRNGVAVFIDGGETFPERVAFGGLGRCGEQGRKSDDDRSYVSHGREGTPGSGITAMHRPHESVMRVT